MSPPPITVYTTKICPYCIRAKMVLKRNGLEFTEVDVSDKRDWLIEKSGQRTVPQIYIGDYHVGGCDDLMAMESAGKLMPLARGEVPAS